VHPAAGNWSGTLLNGLLFKYPELNVLPRAGIVHRLDKDTSGLMVVARTSQAQTSLVPQLQDRTVGRRYLAWVWGDTPAQGKVLASVGRDQRDRLKMSAGSPQGKPAATAYRRLAKGKFQNHPVSLVECRPEQAHTSNPCASSNPWDSLCWVTLFIARRALVLAQSLPLPRQALHAFALSLQHPVTEELVSWYRSSSS
jgi:23S rRNA pseudouridine1911/1915/1917 synthase